MRSKTLKIDTVRQLNRYLGNKTLHPLVNVIHLSKNSVPDISIKFNVYAIILIEGECTNYIYGRKHYDYSNATVLFLSPGQTLQIDKNKFSTQNSWLLVFHPDSIYGTTLGMSIDKYTFFSYHPDEALHLSFREKLKAIECLMSIEQELQYGIDKHSQMIISKYMELLLDYNVRFYERQFITRNDANKDILSKLDFLLDEYILSGQLKSKVPPSMAYFSNKQNLSSHYFSDLLHFETGKTFDEYFQLRRMETAKKMLLRKSSVCQIVELLGYPNIQYFSKLFQKITGTAPGEYRMTQN